ncbi:MAG TPA: secretin N-terminal domain-containing protein [Azospira sp.]|nr:secretin N-terminal domain-containing protein [Azospira sp.]
MSHTAHPHPGRRLLAAFLGAFVLFLAGCAGKEPHRQGMDLVAQGRYEEGLAKIKQAMADAPDNEVYSLAYKNSSQRAITRWLGEALNARALGNLEAAEALYLRVLNLDPKQADAQAGLRAVDKARQHNRLLDEAEALIASDDMTGAGERITQVLKEDPRNPRALALRPQVDNRATKDQWITPELSRSLELPVTLEFRDANLRQVLEALSRYSQLNFVLDKDVSSALVVTVFLRKVRLSEALDVILSTHKLRRRVLNDNTLLIYPDTAAKQAEHQDLMVRNFYLANAEAKQVAAMLASVLKAKNVYADEKLNMIVMRDTPEMVSLGSRLVATQDIPQPEVMLEVEVLEITRSQLTNLGIQYPDQLTLLPIPSDGTTLTLRDLRNLNSRRIQAGIGAGAVNLHDDSANTNLLANPRIRTRNREKALIRIGDRVPVITTTATSTGFISENVQYVDVGLKLEVEPIIYPNDEIQIKMALEVSSVVKEIVSKAGTTSYQIGGRNASTVLRLHDGETQVLGGLINDDDRRAANRFPGLANLPIIGALFSNQKDTNQKTELVLSITPRLVRGLTPPPQLSGQFWSGTETTPRLGPPHLSSHSTAPGGDKPLPLPPMPAGAPGQPDVALPPGEPVMPQSPSAEQIPVAPPPAPPPPAVAPAAPPAESPGIAPALTPLSPGLNPGLSPSLDPSGMRPPE